MTPEPVVERFNPPYKLLDGNGKNVGVEGRDAGVGMELEVTVELAADNLDAGRRAIPFGAWPGAALWAKGFPPLLAPPLPNTYGGGDGVPAVETDIDLKELITPLFGGLESRLLSFSLSF